MAEKQELEITISPEGQVILKVVGVAGKSCLDATREIEDALGVIVEREKTSEYFKQGGTVDVETSIESEGGK